MPLKKTLGLRTSNRVESYFGKLKKFTNTRQKTTNFIDDLNKFHLLKKNLIYNKIKKNYLKVPVAEKNSRLNYLRPYVSKYAFKWLLILEEAGENS